MWFKDNNQILLSTYTSLLLVDLLWSHNGLLVGTNADGDMILLINWRLLLRVMTTIRFPWMSHGQTLTGWTSTETSNMTKLTLRDYQNILMSYMLVIENMFLLLMLVSLIDPNKTTLPLMMLMIRNSSQLLMVSHLLVKYGQMMQHSQISLNLKLWNGSNQTWTKFISKYLSMVSGKTWTRHPTSAKVHAIESK